MVKVKKRQYISVQGTISGGWPFFVHHKLSPMKKLLSCLVLLAATPAIAQEYVLEWGVKRDRAISGEIETHLFFDHSDFDDQGTPIFTGSYDLPPDTRAHVELFAPEYEPLTDLERQALSPDAVSRIGEEVGIEQAITTDRGESSVVYRIHPFRRNAANGVLEKLVSFDIMVVNDGGYSSAKKSDWAANSVLNSGKWVMVDIPRTGMYKITVGELESGGLSLSGQPSDGLYAYHNGGGILPEVIAEDRHDDLNPINVLVDDGGDGVLHSSDVVYFYAVGPHATYYNEGQNRLDHKYHPYAERSHVFFTFNTQQTGLRVENIGWSGGPATMVSAGFNELQFHELDERNLAGTGREWYGEVFDFTLSKSYSFTFPNRITSDDVTARMRTAGKSTGNTRFELINGGTTVLVNTIFAAIGNAEFMTSATAADFSSSAGDELNFTLNFNRTGSPTATGYLDYLAVQARREWTYAPGGFVARDLESVSSGGVVRYALNQPSAMVWDVTEPTRPFSPQRDASGVWLAPADSLRTYVVCTPSDARTVSGIRKVDNQDLHGFTDVDMIIVSHPDFLDEADRLAAAHLSIDQLNVRVVTPQQIYNEFSCGSPDITAIRDFARMLYKKPNSTPLRYLLLFGDASYDYKDRVPNKQNFVPIYESVNSNSLYSSYMTDDYYSCLDDNEGVNVTIEKLDISTGRLPVKSGDEAKAVVDKIINYAIADQSFGDWRNRLTFVSDDVDVDWEAVLTQEPESVARSIDTLYPAFNIEKIYSDSYSQVSTSGSQAYPAARESLYRSVERGNLITAYTGHGGEVGWASERLLQLSDVNSWTNGDHLPLFVTITCEFTRFDDPFRTSAGEQLLLNSKGGAIGLISTTRVVYVPGAISLNRAVFSSLFEKELGSYATLGDIVRRSKNDVLDSDRVRFSLIGDPALRLNIPVHNVQLDSINGKSVNSQVDTIMARETVTLKGRVMHDQGGLFDTFNGEVYVTVFDKPIDRKTKRNDGTGPEVSFRQQENVIYKGRSEVVNGYWTATFIVPRDINYTYGNGKISLYAENGITDAGGSDKTFYVGGLGVPEVADDRGPEIRLFMNDTNFINGGITDENPIGLALVFDSSGVNVVGNGLGHDIIGILDGDESKAFNLNAYYESDLNTYKSGKIEYPFFDLDNGSHNLLVRVWDVMNNVSQASVNFVVADRDQIVIEELFNYPNPFSETTRFSFEHNRDGDELEVELHIVDMNGRIVDHQSRRLMPEGNRTLDMTWDATDVDGRKVAAGVYVFRLVVRSLADGSEAQQSERLVFLK